MNFALFFIIDALAPSQEEEFFEGGKNQFLIIWLLHGVADSCRDKYSGRSIVIGTRNFKGVLSYQKDIWILPRIMGFSDYLYDFPLSKYLL